MPEKVPAHGPGGQGTPAPGHHHGPTGGHGWSREAALARLESPERRQTLDPERFWDRVGLSPGDHVVEVGAGTGYFAIPAARRVAPTGRVYAVDVSSELVELLEERRSEEGVPNLVPVRSTPDRVPLPDAVASLVLLANVLHDVPDQTLHEARRLLAPGGRLVNLDWRKQETPEGPPLQIRLAPQEAEARLSGLGLHLEGSWEPGPYHYAQVFREAPVPPRH
jgi:ubiquinone/menaquinone biosynthesis C-methylase UbiE